MQEEKREQEIKEEKKVKKDNKALRIILWVILGLLIFGLGFYLIWYIVADRNCCGADNLVYDKKEKIQEDQDETNEEQEQTVDSWLTFVDNEYGFKIDYPSDWDTFQIEKLFNFYDQWGPLSDEELELETDRPPAEIYLTIDENNEGLTAQEWAEKRITEGQLRDRSEIPVEEKKLNINGYDVYQIRYFVWQWPQVDTFIVASLGGKTAEITAFERDYDNGGEIKKIYDKMIKTFEFIKPSVEDITTDWKEIDIQGISMQYPDVLEQSKEVWEVTAPSGKEYTSVNFGLFGVGYFRNDEGLTLKQAVRQDFDPDGLLEFEEVNIGKDNKIDALQVSNVSADFVDKYGPTSDKYFFLAGNYLFSVAFGHAFPNLEAENYFIENDLSIEDIVDTIEINDANIR